MKLLQKMCLDRIDVSIPASDAMFARVVLMRCRADAVFTRKYGTVISEGRNGMLAWKTVRKACQATHIVYSAGGGCSSEGLMTSGIRDATDAKRAEL